MKGPTTYAEWVTLLKQFSEGDDTDAELLPRLESGAISWVEGLDLKFKERCDKCLLARLRLIGEKFEAERRRSTGSPHDTVNAIMAVRKRLKPLVRFANIKGFPGELRTYLQEFLKGNVGQWQTELVEDLEKEARYSSRHGDVLAAVKKNPICLPAQEDTIGEAPPDSTTPAAGETFPAFIQKKKKLLF